MFFDKLSDVMVVFVKSMESYVILDKHYLTDIVGGVVNPMPIYSSTFGQMGMGIDWHWLKT